jgi:lipoic acid synthetase
MLGAGEREEEIESTIGDLAGVGCQILTVGQYLSPSPRHLPVARYAPPEEFARWRRVAQDLGFLHVESGPLVRSSYHAERQVGKVTAGSRSPELPLQTANPRTGEALR